MCAARCMVIGVVVSISYRDSGPFHTWTSMEQLADAAELVTYSNVGAGRRYPGCTLPEDERVYDYWVIRQHNTRSSDMVFEI